MRCLLLYQGKQSYLRLFVKFLNIGGELAYAKNIEAMGNQEFCKYCMEHYYDKLW